MRTGLLNITTSRRDVVNQSKYNAHDWGDMYSMRSPFDLIVNVLWPGSFRYGMCRNLGFVFTLGMFANFKNNFRTILKQQCNLNFVFLQSPSGNTFHF